MRQTIPDLEVIDELYYYDHPIVFTAMVLGEIRLVRLGGGDMRSQTFMVSSPSPDMLQELAENRLPLRDASLVAPLFRVVSEYGRGATTIEAVESWPDDALPEPGRTLYHWVADPIEP
ncbi:hypothetical protein OCH239_09695 [Roseivivax halodurans JCM 10272]|uniref:Uncharacterized protein n=1 Tax=Roseivivax halodurans JCM 10272 TaxID=1449350 RepID=X7EC81_9RHOB|nr:hypothetical protein [Roseivivax halodurans]ETX13542.1 hypothetical protein OCH239_09695 [Roseivivax halodurans JCM 10272]